MLLDAFSESGEGAVPIIAVSERDLGAWIAAQVPAIREWIAANEFTAREHSFLRLPSANAPVLAGLGKEPNRWSFGSLPWALPEGEYRLAPETPLSITARAGPAWALGAYRFGRYKPQARSPARLCWPAGIDRTEIIRLASAVTLVRDLINTPANDMGPAELAEAAHDLAVSHGGTCRVTVGDALLAENYPLIHAVGRASAQAPRLIDLTWGDPAAPKVTILGKGVCFDTGGLDLKPPGRMLLMKLDMGGAALALGLASMIMHAELPVRLRILVPAVENAIGGNAMRPLDIVRSRKGLTVEIGDTDAEGRLILADALAEGSRERPDLLIDFATLTSGSLVALGPEITTTFVNDDGIAATLMAAAQETEDPLWRLPLWKPYVRNLEGKLADLTNVADLNLGPTTFASAIYGALFLERFVEPGVKWIHFDVCPWNFKPQPGRPEGGEAHALFAVFRLLEERFARRPS